MATKKFLDATGVTLLWQKIKLTFVAKESGKGLSTNDFTTAYKTKLDGIATGATANTGTVTHVKMNGETKSPTSGVVDLGTVITDVSDKVDKVTGKGLSKNDLTDALLDALANNIVVCSCNTSGSQAAKTISFNSATEWTLTEGRILVVRFSYKNTQKNPTLNVNSKGAKPIYYNGAAITANADYEKAGTTGKYIVYIYNGSQWEFLAWGMDTDTDTTYGTLNSSTLNTGTEETGKLVTAKLLNDWLTAKGYVTLADISEAGYTPSSGVVGTVTAAIVNGIEISPNASNGKITLGSIVRAIKNGNTTLPFVANEDGVVDLGSVFASATALETLQNTVNTLLGPDVDTTINTFSEITAFLANYTAGTDTLSSLLSSLSTSIDNATAALSSSEIEAAIASAT